MGVIKCIVFDFDGVLVESNAIKRNAYFDIFTPFDAQQTVQACLTGNPTGNRFQIVECILRRLVELGRLNPNVRVAELVDYYAEKYNDICENAVAACSPVPGAFVCLSSLARKYSLYINSATLQDPLQRIVRRRGWDGLFRGVMGSPATKIENLDRIIQSENVTGDAILFVGDGRRDLDAANARGCHFVGVRNPDNNFDQQDLISVDDLFGLEAIIRTNWEQQNPC